MKYLFFSIVFILCIGLAGLGFADNSQRISELLKQQQVCVERIQQYQAIIQNNQAEALRLDGAIRELREQDKPKPKEEVKK